VARTTYIFSESIWTDIATRHNQGAAADEPRTKRSCQDEEAISRLGRQILAKRALGKVDSKGGAVALALTLLIERFYEIAQDIARRPHDRFGRRPSDGPGSRDRCRRAGIVVYECRSEAPCEQAGRAPYRSRSP